MCGELEGAREELASARETAKQEVKMLQDKLDSTERKLATTLEERKTEKVYKPSTLYCVISLSLCAVVIEERGGRVEAASGVSGAESGSSQPGVIRES